MKLSRWLVPRFKLPLATYVLPFAMAAFAAVQMSCTAQEPADDVTPPPPPAVFQNRIGSDQLAFLNDYAGRPEKDAFKDKRLYKLFKQFVPRTEYHYGHDMPLREASETVLDSKSLPVRIRDGRYVTVATKEGEYLSGRGFLWFDMREGIAVGGIYFHPVNGEPTPTLAIFSNQLNQTSLAMSQLPAAFAQDLAQWILEAGLKFVSPRYFIPANGKKYVLVHDEDYCWHDANHPAPPQDKCEELNAEGADADLNAAWFMSKTHNAANATAWMLGPEQAAWVTFRDRSCGIGPGSFPCRIRLTRRRTYAILR